MPNGRESSPENDSDNQIWAYQGCVPSPFELNTKAMMPVRYTSA